MKKVIALLIALVMMFTLVACGDSKAPAKEDEQEVYEIVFATQELETTIHSQIARDHWAKSIEEASNGRLKFVFYYSNSYCDVRDLLDNCESGAVDAFWAASSAFAGRYCALYGLTMPGVGLGTDADTAEAMWHWLQEEECASERGSAVLCACYPIETSILANKQINTPEDFKGLRLRAPNSSWQVVLEQLGAVPLNFNLPDAYDNISKNVSDGLIMDYNYLYFNRFYEIAPYFYDDNLSTNVGTIYVSQHLLDRLPDDLAQIILDNSGVEMCRKAGTIMEEQLKTLKEDWVAAGGTCYAPSAEVSAALEAAFELGVEKWIEECNAKGYNGEELYQRLLEVVGPFVKK